MKPLRAAGFSLVELIAAIVVISVGLVGVTKMLGDVNRGVAGATGQEATAQYAQECLERVLQTRRDYGMTSTLITTTMCDAPAFPMSTTTPAVPLFTRALSLPANYTGTTTGACPSGIVCRDVTVTVCTGAVSPCPANVPSSTVTMTMVNY